MSAALAPPAYISSMLLGLNATHPGTPGQHGWHPGEKAAQKHLGFAKAVEHAAAANEPQLRDQHVQFHHDLAYMPMASLDSHGRPWASLVAAQNGLPGFIEANYSFMNFQIDAPDFDPVAKNITREPGCLVGGTGVMFSNRRRNKWAGRVVGSTRTDNHLNFTVEVNESLGNCPKYINVRDIVPYPDARPKLIHQQLSMAEDEELPEDVREHILGTDTVIFGSYYLARPGNELLHPSRVSANHRGGRPGFVRVRRDNHTLVLPDYSGNRFMSTIGNIEANPVAAMTFINWATGDLVYVTGRASNHYLDDAQKIMPSVDLITALVPTGYIYAKNVLTVRQRLGSAAQPSPYSPPVRYLLEERAENEAPPSNVELNLAKVVLHSPNIATFTFETSEPVSITPGQAAMINLRPWVPKTSYQHMARVGQETQLNDDGIRTWTVSSPHASGPTRSFSVTLALKDSGLITPRLFNLASAFDTASGHKTNGSIASLGLLNTKLPLVGVSGGFTLPSDSTRFLWIAGGIGITPFLSMLGAAPTSATPWDVTLIVSTREPDVIVKLVHEAIGSSNSHVQLVLLCTSGPPAVQQEGVAYHPGRITVDILNNLNLDMDGREIMVCGPVAFEKIAIDGLGRLGVSTARIQTESFNY